MEDKISKMSTHSVHAHIQKSQTSKIEYTYIYIYITETHCQSIKRQAKPAKRNHSLNHNEDGEKRICYHVRCIFFVLFFGKLEREGV